MAGVELATRSTEALRAIGLDLAKINSPEPWIMRMEEHPSWPVLAQLRVTLRVGVFLHRFKVKDLLSMNEGQIFETRAPTTEDVPLMIGQVQLAWSEFEAVEQRMALRLTRLG